MTHEPLARPWGWSVIVEMSATREAAVQAIRLFEEMRGALELAPEKWATWPDLTPEDRAHAPEMRQEIVDLMFRSLKAIAVNPAARAEALVDLDVHIAQLRGSFGIREGGG